MFFACGMWCVADVSSVCSDEGLTLETPATHYIPQAKNISYQPLLIKPIFSLLANVEKNVFFSRLAFQLIKCFLISISGVLMLFQTIKRLVEEISSNAAAENRVLDLRDSASSVSVRAMSATESTTVATNQTKITVHVC